MSKFMTENDPLMKWQRCLQSRVETHLKNCRVLCCASYNTN